MANKPSTFKKLLMQPEVSYGANIAASSFFPFLPGSTSMLAWAGEYVRHIPVASMFARAGLGAIALYNGYEGLQAGRYLLDNLEPLAAIDAAGRALVMVHAARAALGYQRPYKGNIW